MACLVKLDPIMMYEGEENGGRGFRRFFDGTSPNYCVAYSKCRMAHYVMPPLSRST